MAEEPEFIVASTGKHIKPLNKNLCENIIYVNDFNDLSKFLVKYVSEEGMDWVYLCFIINDNKEMIENISRDLYKPIKKHIDVNVGDGLDLFWNDISLKEDYYYIKFKNRHFPGKELKDTKMKLVLESLSKKGKIFEEEYPNGFKNKGARYKATDQDKKDTNFKSIIMYEPDKYNNEFEDREILIIFSLLLKMEDYCSMLKFWCKLIMRRETVHSILNNIQVWNIMENIMNKPNVRLIMNYCMFYGLFLLGREEVVIEKNITKDYRFTFNASIARQIPQIMDTSVNNNPWNTYIVGSQKTSDRIIFHADGKRRLTSEKVFNRRFNIATGGVFKNIDLKKFGAIVTGSILAPCAAYNPLEKLFSKAGKALTDKQFISYLNYFYPSHEEVDQKLNVDKDQLLISDIDVAIKNSGTKDFIKKSKEFFEEVRKNIPDAIFKEFASISFIKFKIIVPGCRWIELFSMDKDSTGFDLVRRFHLGSVRMFWDGELYMLTSCMTALLTGICNSHGWISCNSNSAIIILKNAQRGYSTLINKHEEMSIIKYVKGTKWDIQAHGVKEGNLKETLKQIEKTQRDPSMNFIGSFTINHDFFNKDQIGIRYGMVGDNNKQVVTANNSLCGNHFVYDEQMKINKSICGLTLQHRNESGCNISEPILSVIDSVASQLV